MLIYLGVNLQLKIARAPMAAISGDRVAAQILPHLAPAAVARFVHGPKLRQGAGDLGDRGTWGFDGEVDDLYPKNP